MNINIGNVSRKFVFRFISLVIFVISFVVYFATMAPTMSFWDCGEFISCAAKLEVGHAPGAPLFLLIARFFSLFASSAVNIAWWINLSSAFFSALTVMILFATIVDLLTGFDNEFVKARWGFAFYIVSGVLGSLAFAFTDTFWFSAVEAEVYALSLFFTALTFWMVLQWRKAEKNGSGNRWIVLMSYIMGLSIGIHLLNLLTIPVVSMVIYQQKKGVGLKQLLFGFFIGVGILGAVLFGVVQNGLVPASKIEIFLVNNYNMPLHSGLIIWLFIVFGTLIFLMIKTFNKYQVIHFICLNVLVLLIGFGSYAMIIIRSNADTPINLNAPTDVLLLNDYLNRKQYGDKPLLNGPTFVSNPIGVIESDDYRYNGLKYEKYSNVDGYDYSKSDLMPFSRLFSTQPHHIHGYKHWIGMDENDKKLSFTDNLIFFFRYQLNHMYFRYFMWNFSGKQNDIQGIGTTFNGNWISGFSFIDAMRTGNRNYLHGDEQGNDGRNRYFMIPLLIGLTGIFFLWRKKKKGKALLAELGLLFFVTGVFIVLYLNQTPYEPRERDYAYVGSFYAFSIFIGFGCFALIRLLNKYGRMVALLGIIFLFIGLPVLLIAQNYKDHDRSQNYLSIDIAKSYLESCEPNAILFTYGDNDTYPLWYAQEVEGVRPDVRVLNIGLLSASWYIRQASIAVNESQAIHFTIPVDRYNHDDFGYMPLLDRTDGVLYPVETVLNVIRKDNPRSKVRLQSGKEVAFFPAGRVQIDSAQWNIAEKALHRGQLAFIDIIASNYKNRPIYFTSGTDNDAMLGLDSYCIPIGMVARLMFNNNSAKILDEQFNVFMNKISIRNDSLEYYSETDRKTFTIANYRNFTNQLADSLISNNRLDDARDVLLKSLKEYPSFLSISDNNNLSFIGILFKAGLIEEAKKVLIDKTMYTISNIEHFENLSFDTKQWYYTSLQQEKYIAEYLIQICIDNKQQVPLLMLQNVIGIN
ncbi:MAG: DUF2723 domain-containing protein [Marinilabiliaceae bacterium]|nr:DUF2723 domain-containing protein [Marinilabiliaceae bacterium]